MTQNESPESPSLVVYTALFGGYENLVEQPVAKASHARFVCFTDNPDLQSDSWEIRIVEPTIAWDSTRMARKIKITGYREFSDASVTLWIDNRVVLRVDPEEMALKCLGSSDIAMPLHSHRESVRAEFAAVLSAGFDDPARVREQLHYMEEHRDAVLDEVPYWTAIIFRKASRNVDRAMDVWLDLVMRHSRRDQLSINYALSVAGLSPRLINISNIESEFHEWLRVDALPKRKDILFSRMWRYRLSMHLYDVAYVNRCAIALRTRLFRVRRAVVQRRLSRASDG